MHDFRNFAEEVNEVPQEAGVSINPEKCESLIRNPNDIETNQPPSLPVGRYNIVVVEKLNYLRVYFTNNLNRPMTVVRERIKMAYKIA